MQIMTLKEWKNKFDEFRETLEIYINIYSMGLSLIYIFLPHEYVIRDCCTLSNLSNC